MHDSNGRKLVKLFNEACLLLNNGRIKKSYLIVDNRRKIPAFNIYRIHIPYILRIGMLKYWPLRSGIDIWLIKLKSPNHVRYRLRVGLWGVEVISASKRSVWTGGAKNITAYFKLTRSCVDCWPSCPILPLINKIKIVSDIGLGLSSHPRQWHWLIIDSGYEMSALIIVLPKNCVRKFSDEFSNYVFQWGRIFCRTSFHRTEWFILFSFGGEKYITIHT